MCDNSICKQCRIPGKLKILEVQDDIIPTYPKYAIIMFGSKLGIVANFSPERGVSPTGKIVA
jgi:hypothetical protein